MTAAQPSVGSAKRTEGGPLLNGEQPSPSADSGGEQ